MRHIYQVKLLNLRVKSSKNKKEGSFHWNIAKTTFIWYRLLHQSLLFLFFWGTKIKTEGMGFEPTVELLPHNLSKIAP